MKFIYLLTLSFAVSLMSCTKGFELDKEDHPVIRTQLIEGNSGSGAILRGEIIHFGHHSIINHGFYQSRFSGRWFTPIDTVELGKLDQDRIFETPVEINFTQNDGDYYRAFVVTKNRKVKGNIVNCQQ